MKSEGRFSQMIYVSPRNPVVIVRTGLDAHPPNDGQADSNIFQTGFTRAAMSRQANNQEPSR